MKENPELIGGVVAFVSAILKGMKKKLKTREIFLNGVIASILSFGILGLAIYFLPMISKDIRLIIFTTFCIGWIANDFTDGLEKVIPDAYDILKSKFKGKVKNDEDSK